MSELMKNPGLMGKRHKLRCDKSLIEKLKLLTVHDQLIVDVADQAWSYVDTLYMTSAYHLPRERCEIKGFVIPAKTKILVNTGLLEEI
ncbi:hypothetical protein EZV62_009189 [Acer yangbiense]|uniref:Uncharacterized protein n=1 Tax=Acer yangbiense TaxID=1000413 RepID=A0A5C7IFZ6_9ROSI|nr:hypothetical protein EZV62_009189 [Acer yangbiense]